MKALSKILLTLFFAGGALGALYLMFDPGGADARIWALHGMKSLMYLLGILSLVLCVVSLAWTWHPFPHGWMVAVGAVVVHLAFTVIGYKLTFMDPQATRAILAESFAIHPNMLDSAMKAIKTYAYGDGFVCVLGLALIAYVHNQAGLSERPTGLTRIQADPSFGQPAGAEAPPRTSAARAAPSTPQGFVASSANVKPSTPERFVAANTSTCPSCNRNLKAWSKTCMWCGAEIPREPPPLAGGS